MDYGEVKEGWILEHSTREGQWLDTGLLLCSCTSCHFVLPSLGEWAAILGGFQPCCCCCCFDVSIVLCGSRPSNRKQYRKWLQCIVVIQKNYRAFYWRRRFLLLRRAALTSQRLLRGRRARQRCCLLLEERRRSREEEQEQERRRGEERRREMER